MLVSERVCALVGLRACGLACKLANVCVRAGLRVRSACLRARQKQLPQWSDEECVKPVVLSLWGGARDSERVQGVVDSISGWEDVMCERGDGTSTPPGIGLTPWKGA